MTWGRVTTLFLAAVMGVAVIGFFVGLADGVPQPDGLHSTALNPSHDLATIQANTKLIPAVTYAEIANTAMGPTAEFRDASKPLPQVAPFDLFAEIKPSEADKEASSQIRASRRAFNGAPPVIPHAVQSTSDSACYACHSSGMKMAGLTASVMSHTFLANCTQCHAPPPPEPFKNFGVDVETSFVGLPAPKSGKRAYAGAPPTIPHSQWMRENCMACHGGVLGSAGSVFESDRIGADDTVASGGWTGWSGMQSTHPWRTNCTQCHAPSAALDQAFPVQTVPMLPPLELASE